ncbi:MAG: alginate lyase family protein [Anaerolineae bacterium]|nr:alginate lyase family protein [Anaerolineae bacterium]
MDHIKRPNRWVDMGRKAKLFAAKGPKYHYTYFRWRLNRRLNTRLATVASLTEAEFLSQFHLDREPLQPVKDALTGHNSEAASEKLACYFTSRATPHFCFEPATVRDIVDFVSDAHKACTLHTADELCRNIFHFREVPAVHFGDAIDWLYCPHGNGDWTWDLNRHAYFETLGRAYAYSGDERYAAKFRELLLDWLAKNPADVSQPNWSSIFEVGFRINTWIWAFYLFRAAPSFDTELCLALLKGLFMHGCFLEAHIELHAQNNHLLLEAKSLAMLGLLFPEFKLANRWRQRGLKLLYREVEAQVCPDGVHGEMATHYHKVIAGELLELLVLLERNGVDVPTPIQTRFERMVDFEVWVTKPNGRLPLLGDSALEDTYMRYAAAGGVLFLNRSDLKAIVPDPGEAEVWLLGPKRITAFQKNVGDTVSLTSRAFPDGGYFVMRHGHAETSPYLVFDCGPFGYKPVPSHGHADALSFELHVGGQTLLVDAGIYGTQLGRDWRNFFRGTRAHNTVVVDDYDQSTLIDVWRVYQPAQATLHQWETGDHFDFVDGSHNGYTRLPAGVTHRRRIFFVKPEYWVVIDTMTGSGEHTYDNYFHLIPNAVVRRDPASQQVRATGESDASGLIIAPVQFGSNYQLESFTGETNPIQGWVSFLSGQKLAAPTIRYRQTGRPPVRFCTVLYPFSAEKQVNVAVSSLPILCEVQGDVNLIGLKMSTATYVDYLVLDDKPHRRKQFDDFTTDAQKLYIRANHKGDLLKVIMRGGSTLNRAEMSVLTPSHASDRFLLDYQA